MEGGLVSDPTIPEVMRRLDEVTRSLDRITGNIEASYIRRDVYTVAHEALRREVDARLEAQSKDLKAVEEARQEDVKFRRQILAGAAVVIITVFINLALAVSNFVARAAG